MLEEALATVLRGATSSSPSAGRTDRGVHARGQVASHDGEPAARRAAQRAPAGRRERPRSEPAPEGFDARRDARAAPTATACSRARSRARSSAGARSGGRARSTATALDACAAALPGTHDFTAFTPTETDHVRFERDVLRAEWVEEREDVLAFWIEADTFMRHMVRVLVGTMLGRRRAPERFRRAARGPPAQRGGGDRARPRALPGAVRY